jgi:hypothetical protein
LNSEQSSQRLATPPKLGVMEPGGGRDAFKWAREIFADLGRRVTSLDTINEASDVITEGKPHLRIGHPAAGIGMPDEDVEMARAQRAVATSVVPRVPLTEAGIAAIGPTTDASNVDAPCTPPLRPRVEPKTPEEELQRGATLAAKQRELEENRETERKDVETAPRNNLNTIIDRPMVGDKACECGRWRATAQKMCQCGQTIFEFVCDDTDATVLSVRPTGDGP